MQVRPTARGLLCHRICDAADRGRVPCPPGPRAGPEVAERCRPPSARAQYPSDLAGIEPVLKGAGISRPPQARRAVLVGTALSPGQPHRKSDGTTVPALWGELAWQLLGKEGFASVAEADRRGVSPGSDVLRELFQRAAPCLVLIDEWVSFMRQLVGKDDLPAGSFDANLTFAQALTEAARASQKTMVVVSIPASEIEIGGGGGKEALQRLEKRIG